MRSIELTEMELVTLFGMFIWRDSECGLGWDNKTIIT